MVQSPPSAVFTVFGGSRDLIFVGSRNSVSLLPNKLYALRLSDGGVLGPIGVVNGQPAVDQVAKRVYFASRAFGAFPNDRTVWCLDLETGSPCPGFAPQAHGDIDTGVSLYGGQLLVGTNDPKVKAIRTSDGGEDWFYPLPSLEGAPKGYVAVDRFTGNAYFSTASTVWSLNAAGTERWNCPSLGSPSTPVYAPGDLYVYVGAGDGKLYRLDVSSGAPVVAAPFPLLLGDGSAGVGSPTFDLGASFVYVGTEDGTIYAVQLP